MKHNEYQISAKVWLYDGPAAWHFVTISEDISEDIKHLFGDRTHGFGSLPVNVTIGKTTWQTSIFPDKKLNAYLLPIKKAVRTKEGLKPEDIARLLLQIII